MKTIRILVCTFFLLFSIIPIQVRAEEFINAPYLTLEYQTDCKKDKVKVTVSVSSFDDLAGMEFQVIYDDNVLEIRDEKSDILLRGDGFIAYDSFFSIKNKGIIKYLGDSSTLSQRKNEAGGKVMEVTFYPAEGKNIEETEIKLDHFIFVSSDAHVYTEKNHVIEGKDKDTVKIPDHQWGEWLVIKPATEQEEGEETRTCTICGEKETRVIPRLSHVHHLEKIEAVEATCEEDGHKAYYRCRDDGLLFADEKAEKQITMEDVMIKALGHDYQVSWKWKNDLADAAAVFVCSRDASHTVEIHADIIITESEQGIVHKAVVTGPDGKEYTDTRIETDEEVIRLFGPGRYDTSLIIAEAYKENTGKDKFDNIVVASGSGFADALAGGYLAYKKNAPILITNDKKADIIREYIKKNIAENGTVYILGGPSAVSSSFEEGLKGFKTQRLAGDGRYDTNIEILKEAGVTDEEIIVAKGNGKTAYADSLSASASKRPILLVNSDKGLNDKQKEYLKGLKTKQYYIAGGEGAVTDAVMKEIGSYGKVERVAGGTRYDTSAEIAKKFCADAKDAVLAFGGSFPDGLCGGPLAAYLNAPLILTREDKEEQAKTYCEERNISSGYVLGGPGLIPDASAFIIFRTDHITVKE